MSSFNVIIICRESRDDYGQNYERIETQRDLLIKFCLKNNWNIIGEPIMDDDKSGTDFERMEDVKRIIKNYKTHGIKINGLVFKNSSRLGRNQTESLMFVKYLEENNVEVIFEDERYDEETFGLFAWFNERRARDDSKNIRRNLKHKIEEGELVIQPIYGYNKQDKNLTVNPETSYIVKEIFDLYINGWGYNKICKYLNNKNIPTPSQVKGFPNAKKSEAWIPQNIHRILDDRRYVGDYVGGTSEKISFKSKKTRKKDKNKWTIKENHHEAIIDKETWDKVCLIREEKKRKYTYYDYRNIDTGNSNYSGLLICGKCGSFMYKRKGNGRKPDAYICRKYCLEGVMKESNGRYLGCSSHRVRIDFIDSIVQEYIDNLLISNKFRKFIFENVKTINTSETVLINEYEVSKESITRLKKQYKKIYEDKLNDLIPEFIYLEKKSDIETQILVEEKRLNGLQDKLDTLYKTNRKEYLINEAINQIKENGFNKNELSRLFSKIIVFEPGEIMPEEKSIYSCSEKVFSELMERGGIVFHLKYIC